MLARPWYWYYVLGMLFLTYVLNVIDRNSVLALLLDSIKKEFDLNDTQLGLLTGIPFTFFYAFLGIPLARWADRSSRRMVLAFSVALWSGMTALCGMAQNYFMLFSARVGVAVGEAGGSPPSHSLISDYFPKSLRATAFSIFALGVTVGTAAGNFIGGRSHDAFGWRNTFYLIGLPGLLVALVLRLTVKEPPRGYADRFLDEAGRPVPARDAPPPRKAAPPMLEVFRVLWQKRSFRHLTVAAGLHSVAWYAGSAFNASFLRRTHNLTAGEAGDVLGWIAIVAGIGTFLGGVAADRLSQRRQDRRWYLWVPGIATLVMVPFQFLTYMPASLAIVMPSFAVMMLLAAVFFGPSFAMTQALAALRMRSVATSLLLFVQTLIGFGIGPAAVGLFSDWLEPSFGTDSLRYALVIVGLVNVWAAAHYMWGARSLLGDLEETERQAGGM
jgi:predicted MFS family arabinose efflux permease